MARVSIRDLRNHGGEIVDRVEGGEQVTITRSGKPVATLLPLGRRPLGLDVLRRGMTRLPLVDPEALRRDIDDTLDPAL